MTTWTRKTYICNHQSRSGKPCPQTLPAAICLLWTVKNRKAKASQDEPPDIVSDIEGLIFLSARMSRWADTGWPSCGLSPIGDLQAYLAGYESLFEHLEISYPDFPWTQGLRTRYRRVRDYPQKHRRVLDVKTESEWSMALEFRTLVSELGIYGTKVARAWRQKAGLVRGPSSQKDQQTARTDKGTGKRITEDEANVKAREILKKMKDEGLQRLTDRDLGELIGCSGSLANGLPAWKAVKQRLGKTRDGRHKKPKTVHLTEDMEHLVGTGEKDEVLKKLIREQDAEDRKDEHDAKVFRRQGKGSGTR